MRSWRLSLVGIRRTVDFSRLVSFGLFDSSARIAGESCGGAPGMEGREPSQSSNDLQLHK